MVTAVASNPKLHSSQNEKRPPLLPADSDNAPSRRPKGREVSSRYLSLSISSSNSSNSSNTTSSSNTSGSWSSSISSRRSQSPMVGSRAAVATPKSSVKERAVSAERRRPVVAAASTPSNAERILMTSRRSLSVSFQGDSYSMPVSKVKPPPTSVGTTGGLRKGTPERRNVCVTPVRDRREKDVENSRPSEKPKQLWPGRLRGENSSFLSRSLDCGSERAKLSESGARFKELRKSVADQVSSDCESVSSESTASGATIRVRREPRGIVVPAMFWQDANLLCHKVQDLASPVSNNALNRTAGSSKLGVAKKFINDTPVSSPRGIFAAGTLLRGMASPTRCRSGMGNSVDDDKPCSMPWKLSSVTDLVSVRRKSGENRIPDAAELRLLYSHQLQWRLANARVEHTMLVQKHTAERNLYNAWVSTSKLRQSVKSKRIELLLLRLNLKTYSILKEHEPHLENWYLFERDHLNSLSGPITALEASIVRLPVVGGARVYVHKVREALASAVDLMQAMASSIQPLLSQLEQMNLLVSELSNLSTRESNLLQECKEFLSTTFIPLQVNKNSIHLKQSNTISVSLQIKSQFTRRKLNSIACLCTLSLLHYNMSCHPR
ncbi:QWRF motif-containing protein 2 [Dorcoceras hygrometricum]|uniref:QWRF motif-containing protein 2 n=1 Tax=Dorcoceras hygrometricum TaxID=472368 RepID=A0A2Z7DFK8_9LAMI|nr:QWRF motif-containing protein 2 [Dorcoceras hygrometricum]